MWKHIPGQSRLLTTQGGSPTWAGFINDARHGPLPALLLLLTLSTGIVDAVSILALGRVFVANMTGNVIFIGLGLAGAPGFSLISSVVALAAFLVGAGIGGAVVRRRGSHRGRLLRDVVMAEFVLVATASAIISTAPEPLSASTQRAGVTLVALSLGLQNATVRWLGVADLTTTVLTMTLTGIAADVRCGSVQVASRRMASVTAMLVGGLLGALLVLRVSVTSALFSACAILVLTALATAAASKRELPWQWPDGPG